MIPNKGTSSAEPAAAPTPADDAETKPRVLVVDDVFDNRDILTRRLVRRGFDVVEASGGHEALEKIEAEEFDIVLLDIMMPDMSGNEVLETVRRTKSARDLPVIMVTAKSQSEDVVQSLSLGANDYVTKPVDFVVALARINAQLEGKKHADSERADKIRMEAEAKAQKRETDEKLHYLAYHDALTGLMNRTAFREMISDALLESGKPDQEPTVLFIDLDRFKAVNDVHGHEIGDKLLMAVAERLSEIAGTGAKIARLGGDEFGAFLFEDRVNNPNAGFELAERIVEAANRPFVVDGSPFQIGASCGVARASDCENELEQMLKGADLAMYEAKAAGRARPVVFEPRMLEEQRERNALEVDLRRAIDSDELEIHYQPLVNTETNAITTFEALVRWNHPERGLIPPDRFIGIAEDTGIIIPLGRKILRMACTEALSWPDEIRVAVNLSPLQFRDPELMSSIEAVLEETGLPAERLELEITETALLEAGETNLDILRNIRGMGIRVSMDDFGTGYSSMSYLQNFEFDKIKIDQRFVRDLKNGHNGAAIIKAIIDLGVNAGIDTSAEGVETNDEVESIKSQGCVEMQGYFFSRPVNSAGVIGFIEKYLGWGRKSDQD